MRAMGLALNLENWEDVYDANDVDDKDECSYKLSEVCWTSTL